MFVEHDELVLEDVSLLLFSPALVGRSVVALLGFGAKLAHDDGLLRKGPLHLVGVFGDAAVPADVFVDAHDIQGVGKGIVQHGGGAFNAG
jgi:hypothetical protein